MGISFICDGGESKRLVPLKAFYFIHYMAFSTQTFLPMYFDTRSENFSKFQIGVLLALPCICSIIAPPIWGAAADLLQNQKIIHIFCLISAALLMYSLQFVWSFEFMCIMFFIANFQTQPTWSLLDQVAMEMLDRIGGDYGKQRLYGAVGYGIGGYMAGVIAAQWGIKWCFNLVVAISVFSLFILIYQIPATPRTDTKGEFLKTLMSILRQHDVLVLFILVFFIGVLFQAIDSFLFLFLFNMSNNNTALVGIVIFVETTSELPLFFYANKIIERYGTPKVVFLGILAYALRFTVYILIKNPWWVFPIETMHGITFGLVWAAFTNYVYHSAPAGTEGTMIGLLAAVQKGAGGGFGTLAGGWVYQVYGPRTMWAVGLFGVLPICLVMAIWFSFLAKDFKLTSAKEGSDTEKGSSIIRRAPSYGAMPHLGSHGCLEDLM